MLHWCVAFFCYAVDSQTSNPRHLLRKLSPFYVVFMELDDVCCSYSIVLGKSLACVRFVCPSTLSASVDKSLRCVFIHSCFVPLIWSFYCFSHLLRKNNKSFSSLCAILLCISSIFHRILLFGWMLTTMDRRKKHSAKHTSERIQVKQLCLPR